MMACYCVSHPFPLCNQKHCVGSFKLIVVATNQSLFFSFVDCLDMRSNRENVNNAD